jgi:transposase
LTVISDRRVRLVTVAIGVAGLIAAGMTPAAAQDISVNFGQGSGLTERVIQMIACAKYQSGEVEWSGRISRCGDEMMRVMLYEVRIV